MKHFLQTIIPIAFQLAICDCFALLRFSVQEFFNIYLILISFFFTGFKSSSAFWELFLANTKSILVSEIHPDVRNRFQKAGNASVVSGNFLAASDVFCINFLEVIVEKLERKEIKGFLILPQLTKSKAISLKHESSSETNKIFYGR